MDKIFIFDKQRLLMTIIMGMLLGVVCIVGASIRGSEALNADYLFAFWYNRVLMGAFIGLLPMLKLKPAIIRGAIIGLIVSFAFFASTGFNDFMGFFAGIVYGIIIEASAYYVKTQKS